MRGRGVRRGVERKRGREEAWRELSFGKLLCVEQVCVCGMSAHHVIGVDSV